MPAIVNGGDGELIPQAKRTNIELAALNAKTPALLPNAVPNTTVYKGFADTLPAVTNTTAAGGSGGFARLKALYHANGATQHYLQIHIDNGAPIAGDVPADIYRLRANSTDIIDDVYSKNSGSVVLADGTTGFAVPAGSSVFIVRSSTPETYTPITLSAASAAQISLAISRSW